MADRTQRLAIVVTAQDLAAGKLKNVRSELAQMGTAGKLASVGLGSTMLVANKAHQAFGNLKSRITGIASSLTMLGGVGGAFALGTGIASAINQAKDFGQQMELIRTQAGATQGEVDSMSTSLLALARAVGTTPEMLATGLYHVESAGLRGAKALEVLKVAAEGAKVGNADLESVTNALVAANQSGVKGVESMTGAMGSLNAIVGAGNMRMGDLANAMGTGVLSTAKNYGVTLQSVGAALASMTDQGIPAVDAATRLNSAMRLMAAPTTKAIKLLKGIGLDQTQLATDLRGPGGMLTAITDLKKHLDKSGLSLTQQAALIAGAFGGKQSGAILTLIGNVDLLGQKTAAVAKGAGSFGGAWAATQEEAQFKWDRFNASLSAAAIKIGTVALPTVTAALDDIGAWVDTHGNDLAADFGAAMGAAKQLVGAIGTIGGAASAMWDMIPPGFRDLLVKGIVADRTIKFLFGMSPIHLVASLAEGAIAKSLGGVAGGFFGKGTLGNPMIVKDIGGGIGPNLPGGESGLIRTLGLAIAAAIPIIILKESGAVDAVTNAGQDVIFGTDRAKQIQDFQKRMAPGGDLNQKAFAGPILPATPPPFGFGNSERTGLAALPTAATALTATAGTLTLLQQQLHADFADAIHALRKATDPAAIIAAAKRVTADTWKGVGSGKTTTATIADLSTKRDALLAAGDKANAAIISGEIRKLAPLVAGREHQRQLLAQGAKVAASNEGVKQKVADLKGIEQTLLGEHRTTAAATIQHLIDVVNAVNLTTAAVGNITMPTVGNTTPQFDRTGGTTKTKPTPKTKSSDSSYLGQKTAMGISGYTGGQTEIIAGEAGREHVTVIKNPKALRPMGHSGSGDAGAIIAAINRLRLSVATNVNMSTADVQKARVVRSRIVKPHGSRGSLVGVG